MTDRNTYMIELKANLARAENTLAEANSKHGPESAEVAQARKNRALTGKALYDFLNEG